MTTAAVVPHVRRIAWHLVAALTLVGGTSCGDDPHRPPVVVIQGAIEVQVTDAPAEIVVLRDGQPIWSTLRGDDDGSAGPAHFGATRATESEALDGFDGGVQMQFGSFRFGHDADTPWSAISTLQQVIVGPDRVDFVVHDRAGDPIGRGQVLVSATGSDGGGEVVVALDMRSSSGNRTSLGFACADGEHFLGLGGQSWTVDHRGETVPLWVQEDGIGKLDVDDDVYDGIWALTGRRHSTHTPMPMMLSSRGWALAVDTPTRSIFDLCDSDPDEARLEVWDDHLDLHLFVGTSPADSIARMTAWVGRPAVPPTFAFAPWLDAIYGESNVRRVADTLRAADIPVSVIWTEDWRGGNDENGGAAGYVLEEDWRVDRTLYPNFEQLAVYLHQNGFKFLTYANTFVDSQADIYAEATQLGHTIRTVGGTPYLFTGVKFRDSSMLDLTNPAAVAWAKGVYGEAIALGSDGWMADFAEWLPTDAQLASGADALAYHNAYAVDWAKLNWELLHDAEAADGVERLFFARAAHLGSQPYMQVLWAGDQQTDFSDGDGMPSVIPMGIGLGLTGFPYFGHDIAGYMSQTTVPTSRELWFRWVTFGALSPIMRTHHGRSARANWNWESDAASTAHLRRWAKLHMQLVPYQRAMAVLASRTGAPLFRAFVLDWPTWEPGWTITDEYVLGDRIAVAPVMVPATSSRSIRLPPGIWYGLLDGQPVSSDGATPLEVGATLDEIPSFVPDCTLLIMYPPQLDTTIPVGGTTVDAIDVADDREAWLYPCAGSPGWMSVLTEPDGLAYARSGGTFAPTGATWNGSPITFTSASGWAIATVVGPGRLQVGGTELLRIEGGAADRQITLRVALP
jgi:alpha-glucosidase (family GH31 glycosyl hydrolase)